MSESTRRNYTVVARTLERTKREPSAPPPPEEEVFLNPTTSVDAGFVIGWRPDADETRPCYETQPAYNDERANETNTENKDFHHDNDLKKLRLTEQKPQEMQQSSNLNEENMEKVVPQHQVIKMPAPSKYYERSFSPQLPIDKWASSQPINMPEPVKNYKNESLMQPPRDSYPPEIDERRSPVVVSQPQLIQMPTPVKHFMRPPSAGFVPQLPQASEIQTTPSDKRSSEVITQTQMINMPKPVKYYKNESLSQPPSYSYPPEINERRSPLDMPRAVTYYKNEGLMRPPSNTYPLEISQASDRQTTGQPGLIKMPTPVKYYKKESLMQPPPDTYPPELNERRSHLDMPTAVTNYKNEGLMQPPSNTYPPEIPQANDRQPGFINTPKPSNSYPPELHKTNDVNGVSSTLTDRKWPVVRDHVWNLTEKSAIEKQPSRNNAEPPAYGKRSDLSESKQSKLQPKVRPVTVIQRNTGYQRRRADHYNTNNAAYEECCSSADFENCSDGCVRCVCILLSALFVAFFVYIFILSSSLKKY